MSEYIIEYLPDTTSIEREEIVRCRDCEFETTRWSPFHGENVTYCERFVHLGGYNSSAYVEPDGFCAWGERADNFATCKCGEDIETNGRESVTCPICGRVITE